MSTQLKSKTAHLKICLAEIIGNELSFKKSRKLIVEKQVQNLMLCLY